MAFSNLVSLIAFASCALLLSSNSFGVNAVALESHGSLVARHHALHHNMALKKRSNNSQRCKKRPTSTTTPESTTTPDSKPTSSSQPASSSSKAPTSSKAPASTKTSTTSQSQPTGNPSGPSAGGGLSRGLAWAVDNSWATALAHQPQVAWYYHWADGPVPQLSNLEYSPQYWGPAQVGSWNQRVQEMESNLPRHILAQNEPDISGQANQSPGDAANDFMSKVFPYAAKGVKLGSPAIAFDLTWMQQFLDAIKSQGGHVDFICLHWYGKPSDIDQLMSYVKQAHSNWGLNIWVTEIGVTTASGADEGTVLSFMQNVVHQFEGLGFVERLAWFGSFQQSAPIDGFASPNNAFFFGQNNLTPVGNWYANSG